MLSSEPERSRRTTSPGAGRLLRRWLRALGLATLSLSATAASEPFTSEPTSVAACAHKAAERFQIPKPIIAAIWIVEDGRVGECVGPNVNGTLDCGPMGINTVHLTRFAAIGLTHDRLRDDPCWNFGIAGLLLREHYETTGSWYAAVGRYHSKNAAPAARYLRLFDAALAQVKRRQEH